MHLILNYILHSLINEFHFLDHVQKDLPFPKRNWISKTSIRMRNKRLMYQKQLLVTRGSKYILAHRHRFMYQNQSEHHLAVFCIDSTTNVCYGFVRIGNSEVLDISCKLFPILIRLKTWQTTFIITTGLLSFHKVYGNHIPKIAKKGCSNFWFNQEVPLKLCNMERYTSNFN